MRLIYLIRMALFRVCPGAPDKKAAFRLTHSVKMAQNPRDCTGSLVILLKGRNAIFLTNANYMPNMQILSHSLKKAWVKMEAGALSLAQKRQKFRKDRGKEQKNGQKAEKGFGPGEIQGGFAAHGKAGQAPDCAGQGA